MSEGVTPGFAAHDVSSSARVGVKDGQLAAPRGAADYPYASGGRGRGVESNPDAVDDLRRSARYAGCRQPVIDAGDPADNDGSADAPTSARRPGRACLDSSASSAR
jgi:hypothetical protein